MSLNRPPGPTLEEPGFEERLRAAVEREVEAEVAARLRSEITLRARAIIEGLGKMAQRGNNHDLTGREAQLFDCLAQGLSTKEIAFRLGISDKTVRNHLSNIYSKLGVSSGVEAVVAGFRRGILQ